MSTFLRIEAVNLANSIEDTNDLATRRGGSLMLLNAIEDIEQKYSAQMESISTGASVGFFKLKVNADPIATVAMVRKTLAESEKPYRFGTFVVDAIESEFDHATEAALAANRWRQMRALSFCSFGLSAQGNSACLVDEIRPVIDSLTVKEKVTPVSASVLARRQFGMNQKKAYYGKWLERKGGDSSFDTLDFTKDFDDIANDMHADVMPRTLEGKIAVFYADGNKFGNVGKDAPTEVAKREWDKYAKAQRRKLLSAVVDRAARDEWWQTAAEGDEKDGVPTHGARSKKRLRLETLEWGGDELTFVVPAWCGMALAKLFFDQMKDMEYLQGKSQTLAPLTHACGLVFCHRQAPIGPIKAIAKALAEKVKRKAGDVQVNALAWLTLESFDHVGGDRKGQQLDDYLKRRFKPAKDGTAVLDWRSLSLTPESTALLLDTLPKLREYLPRSSITSIVRMMAEGAVFTVGEGEKLEPHPQLTRAYAMVTGAMRKAKASGRLEQWKELWKHLHPNQVRPLQMEWDGIPAPADLAAWVKLIELWDYCVAPSPDTVVVNQGADA